ncbi:MAG: branched chain amino acid aminotransferase [Thermoplasmata archaeon]|nr:MAG: branched chain amino acid aminotransferase [Thermoplasmata archaeon]
MPIQKTEKIWMNGEFVRWENAKVHVLTHALHYGSGVFEGIRCYKTVDGPAIFRLREHIERLFTSAKLHFIDIPYSVEEICSATKELVKVNNLEECYIRPIAFRGYGEMGLNPLNNPVEVAIACWPWGTYIGEEGLKKGIRVKISSFQRISPNILPPTAKNTGQYANSILAKLESLKCGYDEAILLDYRGFVSEGPGENIFVVKNKIIYTPPEHASILKGITRDSVITIARDLGYKVIEKELTRADLYTADEVFFTGTAAEVTPIREIDGYVIGDPGEVTKELQQKFFEITKGKVEKYKKWLEKI